ncbi:MAG: ATP-binding protein [Ginsengibacter sp.]
MFYWFLLAYILAALVFWYISLNRQNRELSYYRIDMIDAKSPNYLNEINKIEIERSKKSSQYGGEGITFFLLIVAGAVFVFRLIRKQLNQSLQQQNFMMAITHELKTPIAVTKLNLETMQKRQLDVTQQQKLISSTIQEANRLNALCNNMLLLSQIDSGGYVITKEVVDLKLISEECVKDFLLRFPKRRILMDVKEDVLIIGDQLLLELVINNLLDNALKYSGNENLVIIKIFTESKFIKLQVIDEGKGISLEEQSKVFEKFYRGAQRQTKGTGLGLYLSRKIINSHNGEINVSNNSPHGCIFEIIFKMNKL